MPAQVSFLIPVETSQGKNLTHIMQPLLTSFVWFVLFVESIPSTTFVFAQTSLLHRSINMTSHKYFPVQTPYQHRIKILTFFSTYISNISVCLALMVLKYKLKVIQHAHDRTAQSEKKAHLVVEISLTIFHMQNCEKLVHHLATVLPWFSISITWD